MRASPLLCKSFVGRSVDEFRRLATIAFKAEGVKGPSGPLLLQDFHAPDSIHACKTMSDEEIGGLSTSSLSWQPFTHQTDALPSFHQSHHHASPSSNPKGYARFHGTISTTLPKDRPQIQRTGFAAWRTLDRPATMFGKSLWDIDMYTYLAMRIRSDGRSYFVNLQTESVVPTDLHQHRLFARRPGEWETVLIKWNDFVRTNHGFVVEPQTEMLRRKVRSVGVGLTDRVPGGYELCIERIWGTNDGENGDVVLERGDTDSENDREGGDTSKLKDKSGQPVRWSK